MATSARALLGAALLVLGAGRAAADVDMTGRWLAAAIGFGIYECEDWVQSGSTVSYRVCDQPGTERTGTIDPMTGAFVFGTSPGSAFVGTAAPDGRTYAGSQAIFLCRIAAGCFWFRFDVAGARCGGGTVDPGEECDGGGGDGTLRPGSCCTVDCHLEPAGTTCDADANPATADACTAAGLCIPSGPCPPCQTRDQTSGACVPDVRASCQRPLRPAATVAIGDSPSDADDALSWAWRRGETSAADLGDPDATTGYRMCVFGDDGQGGTAVVLATDVAPGGVCGAGACWRSNSSRTRFRYRNKAASGIRTMMLASGVAGKGRIVAKGGGAGLGLPPTLDDLATPVTVQLERLDAPVCWQARFGSASVQDGTRFRARGGQ